MFTASESCFFPLTCGGSMRLSWLLGWCLFSSTSLAQQPVAQVAHPAGYHSGEWDGEGDAPDNPGPLARDLSPAISVSAIAKVAIRVADWQLDRSDSYFSQDWTYGALYSGFMAVSSELHEPRYADATFRMGQKFHWELGPRLVDPNYVGHGQAQGQTYDANNQAVAQAYLDLYELHHDPIMIAPTEARFNQLIAIKDNPAAPLWWWCDALFMGPPSWVRLYRATGNRAYLEYMDRQWWATSNFLYDPVEHLYFRDSNFFPKRESNGQKQFWSRGNGWVMAGLVMVLEDLPKDYPGRARYVQQYREMAARLASIQSPDGLWRPGLLDASAYEEPEMSGSAFYVYSITWGVNHGLLDRKKYMPVIEAGWKGMVSHVYADGRVGSIQPIASGPGNFKPSSSYVYGVGGFLLAASELHKMAEHDAGK